MHRTFFVALEFESNDADSTSLPSEDRVALALTHSTAAEAISEALCCDARLELHHLVGDLAVTTPNVDSLLCDVRYAIGQLRSIPGAAMRGCAGDRVRRALDGMERALENLCPRPLSGFEIEDLCDADD